MLLSISIILINYGRRIKMNIIEIVFWVLVGMNLSVGVLFIVDKGCRVAIRNFLFRKNQIFIHEIINKVAEIEVGEYIITPYKPIPGGSKNNILLRNELEEGISVDVDWLWENTFGTKGESKNE
jgi:hypothetical protein